MFALLHENSYMPSITGSFFTFCFPGGSIHGIIRRGRCSCSLDCVLVCVCVSFFFTSLFCAALICLLLHFLTTRLQHGNKFFVLFLFIDYYFNDDNTKEIRGCVCVLLLLQLCLFLWLWPGPVIRSQPHRSGIVLRFNAMCGACTSVRTVWSECGFVMYVRAASFNR